MVGEFCNRSRLRTKFQTTKASKPVPPANTEDEGEQDNKELLSKYTFLKELSALEKLVTF
jgi:hypothetical protein